MILGILKIMFFSAAIRGLFELQKHRRRKNGQRETRLLKPERQPRTRSSFYLYPLQSNDKNI